MMRLGLAALLAISACGTDFKSEPMPYTGDPPRVYVAKVKNVLVGLPPTTDEIAAVEKDPNALGGLVDGWMQLPEYEQKMKVFFELAFQQTQISTADFVDMIPPNGLGVGRATPLVVQNARESFARTVLAQIAAGQPLTDAFTTRRFMMTTALMEVYALMDARRVDDAGNIRDGFTAAHPGLQIVLEASQGPIPIAQSLDPSSPNYMHFYVPDLPTLANFPDPACNGADPVFVAPDSRFFSDILFGEIPPHKTTTGASCTQRGGTAMDVQFAPSDFTDWRMVTVRLPMSGEAHTQFYDLASMRTATELVASTKRIGFFSTPAFHANWPTNQSNQMRVTANQAMIVATGKAFDGDDGTTPSSTPGLDAQHAGPGTACYSCHQLLDPTRSILSATYSWFYYPQTDTSLIQQPGQFAFQGVIQPMATINDFGHILAQHPLVPGAWVQKLCYYVNSAPCAIDDPEYLRIVSDFQSSSFNWNTLVRDIAISPITTNASETKTVDTNGEVIAVARRDHLCAALNSRLGFVDICGLDLTLRGGTTRSKNANTIAQIVSGMPSDGYGRGSTIPVLPNQPTLFYRAGLENICEAVSQMTIDAAVDPNQPGATHWSSAQPDAAISDFVAIVMGLVGDDPRASQANAILTQHFQQALATGASPTDSLRSTFTAACLSPSFIGIGM